MNSNPVIMNGRHLPPLNDTGSLNQKKIRIPKQGSPDQKTPVPFDSSETQRKKKSLIDTESQESLVQGDSAVFDSYCVKPVRKKKKRRIRNENTNKDNMNFGMASELNEIPDDVVPVTETMKHFNDTVFTIPVMHSEPANKLFIEKKRGFKAASKDKVAQQQAQALERQQALANADNIALRQSTIQFALSTHKVFKIITIFLQGVFAGIVLWQIIASYMLLNHGSSVFLTYYYTLASPVQCLFFFLFAISVVAALDRYDLAQPTKEFWMKSITLQYGTICVLFYIVGLVVSLANVFIDERIAMYGIDPLLWNNGTQVENTNMYLTQWQVLNVIRGICAILGWFVISLQPTTDRLTKNLLNSNENVLELASFIS